MKSWWLVLLLGLLCGNIPVHAERDIVYAARYYLPPGVHGTSHFHLYRINADGTGKTQITFGDADDGDPAWSPDGKQILFVREGRGVCFVGANGGLVRAVLPYKYNENESWGPARWLPDSRTVAVGHTIYLKNGTNSEVVLINTLSRKKERTTGTFDYRVSPDERHVYLPGDTTDRIQDRRTGAFVTMPLSLHGAVWRDDRTLIGLAQEPNSDSAFLITIGINGREGPKITPQFPKAYPGADIHDTPLEDFAVLLSIPHAKNKLVYALNNHNSTVGTDYLFFTMPAAGNVLSYLTEGQFLAWLPDGTQFCTAPGRDTTPYEKRPFQLAGGTGQDTEYRTVWSAPLYVRAANGGPMRQITPRLSWVIGADWRRINH